MKRASKETNPVLLGKKAQEQTDWIIFHLHEDGISARDWKTTRCRFSTLKEVLLVWESEFRANPDYGGQQTCGLRLI